MYTIIIVSIHMVKAILLDLGLEVLEYKDNKALERCDLMDALARFL